MPHLHFRNVNDAFSTLVDGIKNGAENPRNYNKAPIGNGGHWLRVVKTGSRVGEVLQVVEPVTVTFLNPREKVLWNLERDANPFLHLFESLWMLAGRNDIAPMAYYAANYAKQVQDGDSPTANGAYGERWRRPIIYSPNPLVPKEETDQLKLIIAQLKSKPESRRVVLEMWTVGDDLMNIDFSKDVCCNTHAYFLLRRGLKIYGQGEAEVETRPTLFLDMTVCNRSNDLVWGMLGANVVHFAFLQEYLAAHIGCEVGVYHQFTNNLHVYTERFHADKWLSDKTLDYYPLASGPRPFPLVSDPETFDRELLKFNDLWLGQNLSGKHFNRESSEGFREPFFREVAYPMAVAFHYHKHLREYGHAERWMGEVRAEDWRIAGTNWLRRRRADWERKKESGNPYLENELARMGANQE